MMFWPMGAFCSKPDFLWGRGPHRNCTWSTPMVRAWSRIAAITARTAGVDINSPPATWSSRTARLLRGLRRRSRTRCVSPLPGADYAGGIAETVSGQWLVSARNTHRGDYALKSWQPNLSSETAGSPLNTVLALPGENLVEPVLLTSRERPKQHPSALHDWNYANLLALDVRQSRGGDLKTTPAKVRLETQDATGHAVVLGASPVESDGSFFVKVPADRPIRFLLVDEKGTVVRQEHGWFWIRRGEQRICVGCHTGPERAAENNVPAVLLRSTTPVDLTGAQAPDTARQAEKGSR